MSVLIELQCINKEDPEADDCYSYNEGGVFHSSDQSQADLLRSFKILRDMAYSKGWREAKLAQGAKGMLCPACVKHYQDQTGLTLK